MPLLHGAAVEHLRRFFGGDFTVDEEQFAVGVAAVRITAGDSERVSLTLVNLGVTSIFVAPTLEVALTRGIRLGPTGGTLAMNVFQDSLLPALEWWAIGDLAAGVLYSLGVRRGHIVSEGEGE